VTVPMDRPRRSAAPGSMLQLRPILAANSWALAGSAGPYRSWPGNGPQRGARASRARAAGTQFLGISRAGLDNRTMAEAGMASSRPGGGLHP